MNSPTMPKANSPPSTPARISSSDRFTPRLISRGRNRLSIIATTIAQTSSTPAASLMSFWNSQATPPSIGRNGPSCARQSMTISAVRTPAAGTPAIHSPMPPSADWTTAVTTMPSATARTAAPASRTADMPRCPASRLKKRSTNSAATSPLTYRMPAMTTVTSMCSMNTPTMAAWPSSQRAALVR